MRITEVDSYSDFIALREKWRELLDKCDHSVFSTWEWLSIWWKHFGRDKKLLLLLAEDDNKILGIAPLMYSVYKMFGLRIGKIEFIGTPSSDYNDLILAKKGEECIKLFIDYILKNFPEKWDCIELKEIPETAQSLSFLNRMPKNVKLRSLRVLHECPYILLPKSFDTLFNQLGYKFRKNLRRNQKQLQQKYKVEFKDYSTTQSFKEGMERMFDLHQKKWKAKGEPGVFANQRVRDFHLEVARSFSQLGWLSLNSLVADGNTVASLYGFRYKSKLYYYLSGIDPAYNRYSVGNLLILSVLEKCIRDELTEFDFLRGVEPYKYRWSPRSRKNFNLVLTKKEFFSWIQNWFIEKYWFFGKRLKRSLKMQ